MLKNKGFEILIASPPEYDQLVAEIYYDGRYVGLVSQEREIGQFDFETPIPDLVESQIVRRVDWTGLCKVVELACRRLKGEVP